MKPAYLTHKLLQEAGKQVLLPFSMLDYLSYQYQVQAMPKVNIDPYIPIALSLVA